MNTPEWVGYFVKSTEQDPFDIDTMVFPTMLNISRRYDCMKFAKSTAASVYIWFDVASANRAETLLVVSRMPALYILELTEENSWLYRVNHEFKRRKRRTNPEAKPWRNVSLESVL